MLTTVLMLTLATGELPPPPVEPHPLVGFAKEGGTWVAIGNLCIARPHDGLGYVLKNGGDGPTELHEQAGRDGTVTRTVALGPARSTDESVALHGDDCGMGHCWDSFERPLARGSGTLQFRGVLSNYLQEWAFSTSITGSAADGRVREECFGGRTYLVCMSPKWEVLVDLTGDPNVSSSAVGVHYLGRHLEGKPEELDLGRGHIDRTGSQVRAVFNNKGYSYAVEASTDPASPGARLLVTRGAKVVVDAPCTAYAVDPQAPSHKP